MIFLIESCMQCLTHNVMIFAIKCCRQCLNIVFSYQVRIKVDVSDRIFRAIEILNMELYACPL